MIYNGSTMAASPQISALWLLLLCGIASATSVEVPIPEGSQSIRLQGEQASAGFSVHAPAEAKEVEVRVNLRFGPGLAESESVVRFFGNDRELGRAHAADIQNESVEVRFSLDSEDLRPGENQIQIRSSLVPKTPVAIEETYSLYAEIELTSMVIDGGPATDAELALAILDSGPGAQPLYLTSTDVGSSTQAMNHWMKVVQAYASRQDGAVPRIHIEDLGTLPTAPGHRVIIATEEALRSANQASEANPLLANTDRLRIDDDGFVTWVFTGDDQAALTASLDEFIQRLPAVDRPLPQPKPGESFTLDEHLSDLSEERVRVQRRETQFLLPYSYEPQRVPERAQLKLSLKADTAVDTRIQIAVNQRYVAEQTVEAGRSEDPERLSIAIPWSSYAAGLNTVSLRVTTLGLAPRRQGAPLELVEPVQIFIPPSSDQRLTPRIAAALTAPPSERESELYLHPRPDNRPAREGALRVLANLASLSGEVVNTVYQPQRLPEGKARTIVIGTPDALDLSGLTGPGLEQEQVMDTLRPFSSASSDIKHEPAAVRRGNKSNWPFRTGRSNSSLRDAEGLLSPSRITEWETIDSGAALVIEDRAESGFNTERRNRLYLLTRNAEQLPEIASSITRHDLSGFNRGASVLSTTGDWQDFDYTVAGTNSGRSPTGTQFVVLSQLGSRPLGLVIPAVVLLIASLAFLGNLALERGRRNRA